LSQRFKEYVISEGAQWDALMHGLVTGFKAYKSKRKEQKVKDEKKELKDKVMHAEGEELQKLIARMVDKGYQLKNGEVKERPKEKTVRSWMLEGTRNVRSQRWHHFKETHQRPVVGPVLPEAGELVGDTQDADCQSRGSGAVVSEHPV
jgi:hypothetical protein